MKKQADTTQRALDTVSIQIKTATPGSRRRAEHIMADALDSLETSEPVTFHGFDPAQLGIFGTVEPGHQRRFTACEDLVALLTHERYRNLPDCPAFAVEDVVWCFYVDEEDESRNEGTFFVLGGEGARFRPRDTTDEEFRDGAAPPDVVEAEKIYQQVVAAIRTDDPLKLQAALSAIAVTQAIRIDGGLGRLEQFQQEASATRVISFMEGPSPLWLAESLGAQAVSVWIRSQYAAQRDETGCEQCRASADAWRLGCDESEGFPIELVCGQLSRVQQGTDTCFIACPDGERGMDLLQCPSCGQVWLRVSCNKVYCDCDTVQRCVGGAGEGRSEPAATSLRDSQVSELRAHRGLRDLPVEDFFS